MLPKRLIRFRFTLASENNCLIIMTVLPSQSGLFKKCNFNCRNAVAMVIACSSEYL